MRTYEALYIITPEMEEDGIQTVANAVEELVTSNEGSIVRSEIWGKRKLAYEVNNHSEGVYVLMRFQADPEFIGRLENYFRLADPIIRYLVVHFDEHTLKLEAEQQRRKEEDLRASAAAREDDEEKVASPAAKSSNED